MSNLQTEVKDICRLADAILKNPSDSLSTTAKKIGVCGAVVGFATCGTMAFTPLIIMHPFAGITVWLIKKLRDKEKERQEKERMLREVIRKQQAVIKKLKEELARNRKQNAQNRQEIENLKEMLRMLEETEEYLNAA